MYKMSLLFLLLLLSLSLPPSLLYSFLCPHVPFCLSAYFTPHPLISLQKYISRYVKHVDKVLINRFHTQLSY
jgi:hypothetical protein